MVGPDSAMKSARDNARNFMIFSFAAAAVRKMIKSILIRAGSARLPPDYATPSRVWRHRINSASRRLAQVMQQQQQSHKQNLTLHELGRPQPDSGQTVSERSSK